jgi:3-methylcrotonyl-CoA carboxylase alpha subunit
MHGKLVRCSSSRRAGDEGQKLAVIEAMKMEHMLVAPSDGTVTMVAVLAGEQVAEGAPVASIEAAEAQAA